MPDHARLRRRQPRSASQSPARLFAVAVAAAAAGLILTLSFGFAEHAPAPHRVRLAVAAPARLTRELSAGLARAAPGGFTVVPVTSAQAVKASVRAQSAAGGLIAGAAGHVTIVTAGAAGATQQQAVSAALTAAAAQFRRQAVPLDVDPLPAADRAGTSVFVFELGVLIPSMIGGIGLFLAGRRLRIWWRLAAAAVYAVLVACAVTGTLDLVYGALTGAGAALAGIGALGALTFAAFVAACQAAVGLPGTGLAALAFIFVGNAVSGGTLPLAFLPGGFREVAPWLPNSAVVSAARQVVYLPEAGLWHPLLVLGIWLAASLLVLSCVDLLHLAERRHAPEREAEIYATPARVHAARRRARRRAPSRQTAAEPAPAP